jgi:hypothetical protein
MIGKCWLKGKPEKQLYIFNENLWKDKQLTTFINKHELKKKYQSLTHLLISKVSM